MIASISNAGSGNAAANAPKAKSSPASSFSDLFDSLVGTPATAKASSTAQSSGTAGNAVSGAHAQENPTQPAAGNATAAVVPQSQDKKPAAAAPATGSDNVPGNVAPGAAAAPACSDPNAADDKKPGEKDHEKDGDDGANSPILLSLVSAAIPAAVAQVNLELKGDANPVQPAADSRVGSIQLPGSALPAAAPQVSAMAEAASQTDLAGVAEQASRAGQTATAEQPAAAGQKPATQLAEEADAAEPVAAHGKVPQTADAQQPQEQGTALKEMLRQTEPATEQATLPAAGTPAVSGNGAAPRIPVVEDRTRQTQSGAADGGTTAVQIQAQASRGDSTGANRSGAKDRVPVVSEESEPEREVKSAAASALADANPASQVHAKQSGESAVRQDVVSQQPEVQVARENSSRPEKTVAAASTETASAGNPAATTATKSNWLNSPRLMQRISQSELRVGIPSDFGDIAVRTAMNHQQLSAEISVQHAGLRDAIVAEMPSLQARLSEQHIPMTNVSVTANAGDGSNGGANSFQQWSHNGQQTAKSSTSLAGEGSNDHDTAASVDVLERGAGLDIRI